MTIEESSPMATVRTRIGPADHGRKMTLEEFWEAEDQPGYLYELVRGVLEVSEVPGDAHWQIIHNLHESFSDHNRRHPGVILRIGHGSDVRYIIPELETDRHPDVAIAFRDATKDHRGRRRAALAVEVVSPGAVARRRDYEAKREDYLIVGILEYWIVDPMLRQVTVLGRVEVEGVAGWSEDRIFRDGDRIVSGLLPEFAGTVDHLWAGIEGDE